MTPLFVMLLKRNKRTKKVSIDIDVPGAWVRGNVPDLGQMRFKGEDESLIIIVSLLKCCNHDNWYSAVRQPLGYSSWGSPEIFVYQSGKNVPASLTIQGPVLVSPCSLPHDPAAKGLLLCLPAPCSRLRLWALVYHSCVFWILPLKTEMCLRMWFKNKSINCNAGYSASLHFCIFVIFTKAQADLCDLQTAPLSALSSSWQWYSNYSPPEASMVNNWTSERILKNLKKPTLNITLTRFYCNLQGVFLRFTVQNLLSPRSLLE